MTDLSQSKGRAAEQEFRSVRPRIPREFNAARGIVNGVLIGAAIWVAIAIVIWLAFFR